MRAWMYSSRCDLFTLVPAPCKAGTQMRETFDAAGGPALKSENPFLVTGKLGQYWGTIFIISSSNHLTPALVCFRKYFTDKETEILSGNVPK